METPIVAHKRVGAEYWRLTLEAPEAAASSSPGQFLMLSVAQGESAPVLPRPMAIFARDRLAGTIDVVYRIVGEGTRRMATWEAGARIVAVGPLGRGFVLPGTARRIILLGRGIGTCSLTMLAADAVATGIAVTAVTSARDRAAIVGSDYYDSIGVETILEVVDEDGTSQPAALRTRLEDACAAGVDEIFVCGSSRLLALAADLGDRFGAGVQVSLEAHMACGIGYCHGCAAGRIGSPRETALICADGPVFRYGPGSVNAT
jgi:dihydroorotate dehydrogenase electron transfer subunit